MVVLPATISNNVPGALNLLIVTAFFFNTENTDTMIPSPFWQLKCTYTWLKWHLNFYNSWINWYFWEHNYTVFILSQKQAQTSQLVVIQHWMKLQRSVTGPHRNTNSRSMYECYMAQMTTMSKVTVQDLLFRIRQSAQGTKRRVFIVETMGGNCFIFG